MRQYLVSGFFRYSGGTTVPMAGIALLEDHEVMDAATLGAVQAILLAENNRTESIATSLRITNFQPLEMPETKRIGEIPAFVSLNLPEKLPPVGCPILICLSGVLVPCERVDHLRCRDDDMTYVLDDKQVIAGRFEWTYP